MYKDVIVRSRFLRVVIVNSHRIYEDIYTIYKCVEHLHNFFRVLTRPILTCFFSNKLVNLIRSSWIEPIMAYMSPVSSVGRASDF